jgi:molybdopterin-guanine dinucleotide biosynthesis protein B
VEALVRELCARGYRIGTIKQIQKEDFTIDTPKKDTWRHAEAGAKIVVSSAPQEVAVIKRLEGEERFARSMRFLVKEDLDLIIVEGNPPAEMPRILVSSEPKSAQELLKKTKGNTVFISTTEPERFNKAEFNVPIFHPKKDAKKMADMLEGYTCSR